MIRLLRALFFRKRKVRKDLVFVSYGHAEELLKQGYTIAREEDHNHVLGFVYLELLVEANASPLGARG
jgi:hypothetical protein